MKKFTLVIFFALVILKVQAQDYLISFAGAGAPTTVDSVRVNNLSSGATLTLNGGDILHLSASVGISATDMDNGNIQIYPNPIEDQSTLTFIAPENGFAVICIVDLSGKTVYQTGTMLSPGRHSFRLSGIGRGIYFVKVTGNGYFYSAKLIGHGDWQSGAGIVFLSSVQNPVGNPLKSPASTIDMHYTNGDQLLFKGTTGQYSTVVSDVPTGNKTITFNFLACTDADNNHYATVTIGAQTWMAENLKVGVRIDGSQNQTNNSFIEKYCYNNEVTICNIYGGLYQWNEMMQYVTTEGVLGICPTGWHIPTDDEWTTVTTFLGGTSVAGGKMKSTGTIEAGTGLWYTPNAGATNESGLTAIPAGRSYDDGMFGNFGARVFWWSSSESTTNYALSRFLYSLDGGVVSGAGKMSDGFSVRCLKDLVRPDAH